MTILLFVCLIELIRVPMRCVDILMLRRLTRNSRFYPKTWTELATFNDRVPARQKY